MDEQPQPMTCAEAAEQNRLMLEALTPFLEEHATVITHELCGGMIAEHVFTEISDEGRLLGFPTSDTMRINEELGVMGDIAPVNVTHLDRIPLRALAYAHPNRDQGPDDEELDAMLAAHERDRGEAVERIAKMIAEWAKGGCEEVPQDLAARIFDDDVPF